MSEEGGTSKKSKDGLTLQVRFVTKQEQYSIPDFPFVVESNLGAEGLNSLVNQVLKDDGVVEKQVEFDFLVGDEFLRGSLEELVLRHEALKKQQKDGDVDLIEESAISKIGVEEVIEIEYVERTAPPEPENALMHDDWVAAVDATDKWVLTGAYDGTLHLWSTNGKHKLGFSAHNGPVKTVCWISTDETNAVFASGSHDQTIMIWQWDLESNKVSCKWVCKGHKRSVDSLKEDPTATIIGSGSFDGELKIWSASLAEETSKPESAKSDETEEDASKNTRVPFMTLGGHKEAISSVCWSEPNELITSSWDHTIKLWDVEMGGMKSEICGNKAFFGLSWSDLNKTAVTCSADRHIRLYDPRSKEGSIVKSMFTSHSGWVVSVNWSKTNENLFISGSHDMLLKLWDRRSPRAPLYNMTGFKDKVLCTSWANPELIMGGGSDNSLRMFRANSN